MFCRTVLAPFNCKLWSGNGIFLHYTDPIFTNFPCGSNQGAASGRHRTCNNYGKKCLTVKTNLILNTDEYTMRNLKSTKSQCEQLPEYYNFSLTVHSLALLGIASRWKTCFKGPEYICYDTDNAFLCFRDTTIFKKFHFKIPL